MAVVIKNIVNMSGESFGEVFRSSRECMEYARDKIYNKLDDDQEHGVCMYFNGGNEFIKYKVVSSGHQDSTAFDPKIVFRHALLCGASKFVMFHNHNIRGRPYPSEDDIKTTKRIIDGGIILCIEVVDHIIISKGGWFSFRNNDKKRRFFS